MMGSLQECPLVATVREQVWNHPGAKTDFHQIPPDNVNFTDNSESIMWSKMQIKSPHNI